MHPFIIAISFCSIFLLFVAITNVSAQPHSQPQQKSSTPSVTSPSPFKVNLHATRNGHRGPHVGHHRRHRGGHHPRGGHRWRGGHHRRGGRHRVSTTGVPPSPPVNQNLNQTTHDAPSCQGNENFANPGKVFGYIPRSNTSDKNILLMDEFLHAHNWVRRKYNLPSLTWDTKLASFSRSYLMSRYNDCKMIHSSSDYGENLFWGKKLHWTPSDAVYYWYYENNWYNLNTLKCLPNKICGHFTQLVWKDSVRVGCAVQHCNDRSLGMLIACEYDPPGNYPNENPLVQHNQR